MENQQPKFNKAKNNGNVKYKQQNNNGKKPFKSNYSKNGKPPFKADNVKRKQQSAGNTYPTIKKKLKLKPTLLKDIPDRRIYRLAFIFGSTQLIDIFTIEEPFLQSMVPFRDKLLKSYQDLLKLISADVVSGMLPRPNAKNLPVTDADILSMDKKDIIHSLTVDICDPVVDGMDVKFCSVASYRIQPGMVVNGVTKRVAVRVNLIRNPNFELKQPAKVANKQKQPKKAYKAKATKPTNKKQFKPKNNKLQQAKPKVSANWGS